MKKIIIAFFALVSLTVGSYAQTMADALTFSQTEYFGTARSMAMGNAVTAIGGDLGTIGINPAGSAVASYSQFTITPAWSNARVVSAYSPSNYLSLGSDGSYGIGNSNFAPYSSEAYKRMEMPNLGFSLRSDMGGYYGLRSVTFSFTLNNNQSFVGRTRASGINESTSMLGYFASAASFNCDGNGACLDPNVFSKYNDPYDFFNKEVIAAYDSYMISTDGRGRYIGATQSNVSGNNPSDYPLAGPLKQTTTIQKYGVKRDVVINSAINWEDKLYVGFNIGIPVIKYASTEVLREDAVDQEQFPLTMDDGNTYYFQNATYSYDYSAHGEGLYAKIGIIYLPVSFVRLGLAIQTPTFYEMSESWTIASETNISSYYHSASGVPTWTNDYDFIAPGLVNLGAAVTIGDRGLVSADYEISNYSRMKYMSDSEDYLYETDYFYEVNRLNRLFCGASHSLRLGAEYRINPAISVRAGYNVTTSPLKYYIDSEGYTVDADEYDANFSYYESGKASLDEMHHFNMPTRSFSAGIGWSSSDSFFLDAAFKSVSCPISYYSPYPEYHTINSGLTYTPSPLIASRRRLCYVSFTFGWRF